MNPTREQLREAAPELASFVDAMREQFGEVKVLHLKVDALGYERGTPVDPNSCAPWVDGTPIYVLKAKWEVEKTMQQMMNKTKTGRKKK